MLHSRRQFLVGIGLAGGAALAGVAAFAQTERSALTVMTSGAFATVLNDLAPDLEHHFGVRLSIVYGASMGATPNAIPARLARNEPADVVILAADALRLLIQAGRVRPGTAVDLVRSRIGLAVRAGASVPDISTVAALKRALLQARSIAYSDSASGVYVQRVLFDRLGIRHEVEPKAHMIPGTPVGVALVRGEAELGFQQISELLAVPGVTVVGPLPDAVQHVTVFSAGITSTSMHEQLAKALIGYLASAASRPAIRRRGLDPIDAAGAQGARASQDD